MAFIDLAKSAKSLREVQWKAIEKKGVCVNIYIYIYEVLGLNLSVTIIKKNYLTFRYQSRIDSFLCLEFGTWGIRDVPRPKGQDGGYLRKETKGNCFLQPNFATYTLFLNISRLSSTEPLLESLHHHSCTPFSSSHLFFMKQLLNKVGTK